MTYLQTDFSPKSIRPLNHDVMTAVTLGAPIALSANRIVTSVNLTNAALVVAAQPDVPRNVIVTVTDTTPSITAGTVTVAGQDAYGNTITEVFDFSTFTSATAKTGTKIFGKVTSVVTTGFTVLGGSGDELIVVGVGNVIGLPTDIVASTAVVHVFLGGTRVTTPTVAVGVSKSGVDVSSSTLNGTKTLLCFYNIGG
jgi:hypothetical protein